MWNAIVACIVEVEFDRQCSFDIALDKEFQLQTLPTTTTTHILVNSADSEQPFSLGVYCS